MPALQLIDLLMLLAELRFRVIQLCPESAHLAAAKCGTAKRVHAQRSAFLPEPRAGGTQDLLNQVPPKRPCESSRMVTMHNVERTQHSTQILLDLCSRLSQREPTRSARPPNVSRSLL
jgi:hypothetical protein